MYKSEENGLEWVGSDTTRQSVMFTEDSLSFGEKVNSPCFPRNTWPSHSFERKHFTLLDNS